MNKTKVMILSISLIVVGSLVVSDKVFAKDNASIKNEMQRKMSEDENRKFEIKEQYNHEEDLPTAVDKLATDIHMDETNHNNHMENEEHDNHMNNSAHTNDVKENKGTNHRNDVKDQKRDNTENGSHMNKSSEGHMNGTSKNHHSNN